VRFSCAFNRKDDGSEDGEIAEQLNPMKVLLYQADGEPERA
jgi:hypothetical protein